MSNIERRFMPFAEFRADDKQRTIKGHAATFNDTYDLGLFEERIAPGAFDDVLGDDVRALWNHDQNHVLGRTKSGTLRISVDKRGLFTEIDLPDSQPALREAIERGDVDQMSFGFTVKEDMWEERDGEVDLRTITKFARLYDVSPVTFPANPNTDVALRSLTEWREANDGSENKTSADVTGAEITITETEQREPDHALEKARARLELAKRA